MQTHQSFSKLDSYAHRVCKHNLLGDPTSFGQEFIKKNREKLEKAKKL